MPAHGFADGIADGVIVGLAAVQFSSHQHEIVEAVVLHHAPRVDVVDVIALGKQIREIYAPAAVHAPAHLREIQIELLAAQGGVVLLLQMGIEFGVVLVNLLRVLLAGLVQRFQLLFAGLRALLCALAARHFHKHALGRAAHELLDFVEDAHALVDRAADARRSVAIPQKFLQRGLLPAQHLRAALLDGASKAILVGKQLVQIAIGAPERLVDGERLAAFFHGAADVPQQLCRKVAPAAEPLALAQDVCAVLLGKPPAIFALQPMR